jgi:hypothetical protein
MDLLSAVFFVVAGVWLIAAILYSIMVLYFLRLRSHDLLHTISDDDFGRFYVLCCLDRHRPNNERCYIPFGCLFRRYARHLNIELGNDMNGQDNNARHYTRAERRKALIVLLMDQQRNQQQQPHLKKQSTGEQQCKSGCGSVMDQLNLIKNITNNDKPRCTKVNAISESCTNQASKIEAEGSDVEQGITAGTNYDSSIDELPMCSICLGPYDDDHDSNDKYDTNNIHSTIFQSQTCVHQFHKECILNWLQRRSNTECPCCRISMVDDNDVWKTIQHLRKEKRKKERIEKRNRRQEKQSTTTTSNTSIQVDETQSSETEQNDVF